MDFTKEVKAVYKLIVYENGELELKLMPTDYIFDDLRNSKISEKIQQIIAVIKEVKKSIANISLEETNILNFKKIVTADIKKVASQFQVTEQTVLDKTTRQLGITKDDFVSLLFDFFKNGYDVSTYSNSNLYKKLMQNVSCKNFDKTYIKESFKNIVS